MSLKIAEFSEMFYSKELVSTPKEKKIVIFPQTSEATAPSTSPAEIMGYVKSIASEVAVEKSESAGVAKESAKSVSDSNNQNQKKTTLSNPAYKYKSELDAIIEDYNAEVKKREDFNKNTLPKTNEYLASHGKPPIQPCVAPNKKEYGMRMKCVLDRFKYDLLIMRGKLDDLKLQCHVDKLCNDNTAQDRFNAEMRIYNQALNNFKSFVKLANQYEAGIDKY